jgi:hypothetical protein
MNLAHEHKVTTKHLLSGSGCALVAIALACWGVAASAQGLSENESHDMRLVGLDDLQGRSAYHGVIQEQGRRWIAYIGHHNGMALNPLTGVEEVNGTSIVDVTNPRSPRYLFHRPAEGDPGGTGRWRGADGADLHRGRASRRGG